MEDIDVDKLPPLTIPPIEVYRHAQLIQRLQNHILTNSRPEDGRIIKSFSGLLCSIDRTTITDYLFTAMIESVAINRWEMMAFMDNSPFVLLSEVHNMMANLCTFWPWLVIDQLQHPDPVRRYQVVELFKRLFESFAEKEALPNLMLHIPMGSHVWPVLLRRFIDADLAIRKLAIEVAVALLRVKTLDYVVNDIREALRRRLRDEEPEVRLAALQAIFTIAEDQEKTNVCDPCLMLDFALRCGDTEPVVRAEALRCVGAVFSIMIELNIPGIISMRHLFMLASACLLRYKLADEEDKGEIEKCFCSHLIRERGFYDPAKTATRIVYLVCHCEPEAVAAIAAMFYTQHQVRLRLWRILRIVSERMRPTTTDFQRLHLTKQLDEAIEFLARDLFPGLQDAAKGLHRALVDSMEADEKLLGDMLIMLKCYRVDYDTIDLWDRFVSVRGPAVDGNDQPEDGSNGSGSRSGRSSLSPSSVASQRQRQSATGSPAAAAVTTTSATSEGVGSGHDERLRETLMHRSGSLVFDLNVLDELLEIIRHADVRFSVRLASFIVILTKVYGLYFQRTRIVEKLASLPPSIAEQLERFGCCQELLLTAKLSSCPN